MDESRLVTKLEILVRTLSDAGSAPDVFRALIEGLPLIAPRSAVYLVRQNTLKGWRCLGYTAEATERLRGFTVEANSPASRLGSDGLADLRSDGTAAPNFGQSAPHESVAVTVTVKGKPIALMVAERNAGESPWQPAGLSLLAHAARLRLELSLSERKVAAQVAPAATPPSPAPAASAVAPRELSPAQPPAEQPSDPRLDAAKRFARLVATDIRLYNEEAVVLGRRNGDLADRLDEPIALGQRSFTERFGDMGPTGTRLLQQALVDVLAGGDPNLLRQ